MPRASSSSAPTPEPAPPASGRSVRWRAGAEGEKGRSASAAGGADSGSAASSGAGSWSSTSVVGPSSVRAAGSRSGAGWPPGGGAPGPGVAEGSSEDPWSCGPAEPPSGPLPSSSGPSPGSSCGASSGPSGGSSPRAWSSASSSSSGSSPGGVERAAPTAVGQGQQQGVADVVVVDLVAAPECRQRPGAASGDQVGPQPVDSQPGAGAGDQPQHPVAEPNPRQQRQGGGDLGGDLGLGVGPAGGEGGGIGLEGEPPPDDLGAHRGVGRAGDGHGEPEAVEQLRPQVALLRVHRADEHEPRRVADGDVVAFDDRFALGGRVEQHVDEVIAEQVDLVDVEDPAVGAGEQAGLEHGVAVAQRPFEVEGADDPVDGRADRQLDELGGTPLDPGQRDVDGGRAARDRGPRLLQAAVGDERRRLGARRAVGFLRGGSVRVADDHVDRRQQRFERADGGRLRGPALAADEHAADLGRDGVDQEGPPQVVLADEGGEGEPDGGHAAEHPPTPPPISIRAEPSGRYAPGNVGKRSRGRRAADLVRRPETPVRSGRSSPCGLNHLIPIRIKAL